MTHADNDFAKLVSMGTVRQSRRDLLRVSALSAVGAMSLRHVHAATPHQTRRARQEGTATAGDGMTLHLPFNPFGQEVTVDPHRTVNWGPFWVMLPYAWSGLLRFDENGGVEADLAETVEPNDDGSVWTATLRESIAFADGTAITADHFVSSWLRALDAAQLTPMYRFFEPVVGAVERSRGENMALGVNLLDERTLEIHLSAPLASFPAYLATFGYAVVHPGFGAVENPVDLAQACSGAWSITSADSSTIRMEPNAHYWGEPSPDITSIEWMVAPSGNTDQTILDWYRADDVAVADVPIDLLASFAEDNALQDELTQAESQSSTMVLALDFHQAPFNDVRVRRAVAAAIDRDAWSSDIELGTYVPASSFSPPVLATIANYTAPTDSYDDDVEGLLEAADFDAANEDEIVLFQPATDSTSEMDRVAKLIAMISEATGISITHDTALTAEQITAARQDVGGLAISLMQWQIDTDTPSLLGVIAENGSHNTGWINWESSLEDTGDYTPGKDAATYSELVAKAAIELDEDTRNTAYADAEALLLKNAVYIPVGFWNPTYAQKPWLTGTRQGPWSGSTPVRIDADVAVNRDLLPQD